MSSDSAPAAFIELHAVCAGIPAFTIDGRLYVGVNKPTALHRVISVVLSDSANLVIAATLHKVVHVLRRSSKQSSFESLAQHKIPKRATSLALAPCGTVILLGDAFGDVYKLPLDRTINITDENVAESARALGHFSTVTSVAVTSDQIPVIATADRDARVRVSRWPSAFVIESFCLGHTDAITALLLLPSKSCSSQPDSTIETHDSGTTPSLRVISGAADGTMRLWDENGGCIDTLTVPPLAAETVSEQKVDSTIKGESCDGVRRDSRIVAALARYGSDGDTVIFAVIGECTLRIARGISNGCLQGGNTVAVFDGPVSGVFVDEDTVWVSIENRMVLVKLRIVPSEGGGMCVEGRSLEPIETANDAAVENGDKSQEQFNIDETEESKYMEKPETETETEKNNDQNERVKNNSDPGKKANGKDGSEMAEENFVDGRFAWLGRQPKKEMVEGWKGKKRKHVQV